MLPGTQGVWFLFVFVMLTFLGSFCLLVAWVALCSVFFVMLVLCDFLFCVLFNGCLGILPLFVVLVLLALLDSFCLLVAWVHGVQYCL